MSAYGCETLLFFKGFNSRNYYDGAIGEKKTNLLKKKELLNAIAKSETGKILVRGSKARLKKN